MRARNTMAQETALQVARLNNVDIAKVRLALDTHYTQCPPCWIILEQTDHAEVVYEADPDIIASARNRPGRFVAPI